MQFTKYLTLTTLLFLQTSLAAPAPQPQVARACDYTCGSHCYSSSAVSSAQNAGYNYVEQGGHAGSSSYPHVYKNYEDFDFPVQPTYYEFPILSGGSTYSGGSPGADRVIFNEDGELAGLITHSGASGNNFVACE
ncbi:extracellular guanyl-specific ribonuclease RntA [Aspergillus glaucus CBS 516.65]|uniref:ribonuclease T1 n=1 Tax=Aspergillus glaucus CBS 516.65 TaxID=1160497 RepID=A0A1L9VXL7_ASPGL|nr:hypothetical protein ASPGLDRAFT_42246 [Aspergillus glaucus CBS 516.65]OJJ88668.1 hypothetical protein ASPGLDRAFT_42246 [Aspergillus glaucus CBS 516.65]